jgi:outer membrane protease
LARSIVLFLALILMLPISSTMSWADGKATDIKTTTWQDIFSDVVGHYPLSIGQINTPPEQSGKPSIPKNWVFDFGLQRFLMSHTSYEFGNPTPPFQKPLSRLEFPLNTWWLECELRRTCPRWSIGGRAGLSVARNTDGRFKDSDWTNPGNTDMKTIYSESACRAEANYLFRGDVDVNISDWLRLPPGFEIRPLFAFEFQRLSLMVHDGVQWEFESGQVMALPGDGIHFRQDYFMYQIGLRGAYDGFKIGKYITIKVTGEADWGPALGYNEDHHLEREGDRFTYEKTSGNSLYFSTGVNMVFAKTITAGITMDYLWIRTNGVHRLSNVPMHEDETWPDGVKTWSDQTSLIAHVSYAF